MRAPFRFRLESTTRSATSHTHDAAHGLEEAATVLVNAASLARLGLYEDAERALVSVPTRGPLAAQILDLAARVYAQQGRLIDAERCWIEAVRLVPTNATFHAGLACVADHARPMSARRVGWLLVLCAILAGGVLAAAIVVRDMHRIESRIAVLERGNRDRSSAPTPSQSGPEQPSRDAPSPSPSNPAR
jgi:tetratricopeptide (TPR) repeat protein